MGVPVDDIVVLLMADYGVNLYGNTIIVNPKFAADKPDAVKGFLRAFLKGLKDTVKDPSTAVDSVIKRNDVAKKPIELERLKMALDANILTPEVKKERLRRRRPRAARQGDRPDRAHLRVQERQAEGGRRVRRLVPAVGGRSQGELTAPRGAAPCPRSSRSTASATPTAAAARPAARSRSTR